MQRTFVFIKPDGVERNLVGDIIRRFEEGGLKLAELEMITADEGVLAQHYPLSDRNYILTLGHNTIEGKSEEELEVIYNKNYKIIKDLQDYVKRGPIVKMVLEGDDAVAKVRQITGKTNPPASDPGTIRGDLGIDSFEKSDAEGRAVENLIHASGTPEEAEIEIELWFPNLK